MADNTATYGIEIEDGVSGPSQAAATALDRLKVAMDRDTAALAQLQKGMRNLKGGGAESATQMARLQQTIDATRARLAKAQGAFFDLGGGVNRTARVSNGFRERMAALQGQMTGMPGPLGRLTQGFDKFAKLVGGGWIAAGILGTAAALGVLAVATARITRTLYDYVTATQNARRTEQLRLEGLTRQWSAVAATYGLAKMKGTELQAGIDRVAASVPLAREQVARYGQQLYNMGLRGKAWESALEGMSIKASTQSEEQAHMFASWAAGTALMGGSVEKMTDRVKARLGGLAKAQMLDANVQALKLRENFDSMFRTVDIEPLLKAKASLYAMFSQSTASGRYLADLLGRIVNPLISATTRALPLVKSFFQTLIIWALRTEIEYLHMRNALADAFSARVWKERWDAWKGPLNQIKDLILAVAVVMTARAAPQILVGIYRIVIATWGWAASLWETALAGKAAFLGMARGAIAALPQLWATSRALVSVAARAALAAAPFVLTVTAVFLLIKVLRGLKQIWDELDFGLFWKQVKADWESFDIASMGVAIIDGIASGLANPGKIFDAIKGIARKVINVFTGEMEISSPSKVFARLGREIPAGVGVGVEQGAHDATSAVESMALAQPVAMAAAGGGAPVAAGGGGTRSVTINGGVHVHGAGGGATAKQLAFDIKRELESILEGAALQMGAV